MRTLTKLIRPISGRRCAALVTSLVLAIAGLLFVAGPAQASPPANDDIANAEVLSSSLPVTATGTNVDAARQPGEPDHLGIAEGASVWYEWTAPSDAPDTVWASTYGSDFDTTISVYTGSPGAIADLHLVDANDDFQQGAGPSRAAFDPTPNTEYYIAVDGSAVGDDVPTGTIRLKLSAASSETGHITGRVTDENNQPVRNLCVFAVDQDNEPIGLRDLTTLSGTYDIVAPAGSDDHLLFRVCGDDEAGPNVAAEYWSITGSAQTLAEADGIDVTAGGTTSGKDAQLARGTILSGTVTGPDTDPAADACVRATKDAGGDPDFVLYTRTDEDGHYEIAGLDGGTYLVRFGGTDGLCAGSNPDLAVRYYQDGGLLASTPGDADLLTAVEGGPDLSGIDADLGAATGRIKGTVLTATGTTPVANICVRAQDSSFTSAVVDTNAAGKYTISNVPAAADYVVRFTDCHQTTPVYLTQYYNGKSTEDAADQVTVVSAVDTTGIDASLAREATIGGQLTDANGNPRVPACYKVDTDTDDLVTSGQADNDGRWSAEVDPGTYKIRFYGEGCGTGGLSFESRWYLDAQEQESATLVPVGDGASILDLDQVLPGTPGTNGRITGRVTDDHDAAYTPLAGVCVTANENNTHFDTTSDAFGRYVLDVPAGDYHVEFSQCDQDADYSVLTQYWHDRPTYAPSDLVTVTAGTTTADITARMHAAGTIAGVVTDESTPAKPLPGICVSAYTDPDDAPNPFAPQDVTDANGAYHIKSLPAGPYFVTFEDCSGEYAGQWYDDVPFTSVHDLSPAGDPQTITVTAGQTSTLDPAKLVRNGTITGTVTDEAGDPIEGICVYAMSRDDDFVVPWNGVTDAQGHYLIGDLQTTSGPENEYHVWFNDCMSTSPEPYGQEYYDNKLDEPSSAGVAVVYGEDTPNIDAVLQSVAPVNTSPPTISGRTSVGGTLTAHHGTWLHEPSAFHYQWQRCNAVGEFCAAADDGHDQTYVLGADDLGYTFKVTVSAQNSVDTTAADSALTDVIDDEAPPNDDIANREVLTGSLPIAVDGTNVNATRQAGEPYHLGQETGASIWYAWTAPTGGDAVGALQVSLEGSDFDTTLSVYSGSPSSFSGLTLVTDNDDSDLGSQSLVSFAPVAGRTYYIAVDGYPGTSSTGAVQMSLSATSGISGTVTGTEGGIPDICVSAEHLDGIDAGQAKTAADGTYVLPLPPGDYTVEYDDCATTQEYDTQYYDGVTDIGDATPVHVAAGALTPDIDADLDRLDGYGSISGTVTNEAGTPVSNICVSASPYGDPDALLGETQTARDGTYVIRGLGDPSNHDARPGYLVDYYDCSGFYGHEYYDNQVDPSDADLVPVPWDHRTTGIDAELQHDAPVDVTPPTITGPASVGATLTAHHGSWDHSPSSYVYQWQQCDAVGDDCSPVGTDRATYRLQDADLDHTFKVTVTATNPVDSTDAVSELTDVVDDSPPPNDDIADLEDLGGSPAVEVPGSTVHASRESGEPQHLGYAQGASVWYSWTAPSGPDAVPTIEVGTLDADFNATLSVYDGTPSPFTGLHLVGENDPTVTGDDKVSFTPVPGTTYYFAVDGVVDGTDVATGSFDLEVARPTGISGTVTNATGDPVGDICVVAYPAYGFGGMPAVDQTGSDGTYLLDVAAEDYDVAFVDCVAGEYDDQFYDGVTDPDDATVVTAHAGEITPGVDATLVRGVTFGSIAGTVTDDAGDPAADICVTAYLPDGTEVTGTHTADDGSYLLRGLGDPDHPGDTVDYAVGYTDCSGYYGSEYYDNALDLDDADLVTVHWDTRTSGINAVLQHDAPANTSLPTISGSLTSGSLTADPGEWDHEPSFYDYQWVRCDSAGDNCAPISSAATEGYSVVPADAGHRLRVTVTAVNSLGASSITSDATALVAKPGSTQLPVVTGTPNLGATLSVDNGTWTGSPTSYAYAWERCDANATNCTPISGATTASHVVVAGDAGYRLRAQITATNAAGTTPTWSKVTALIGGPSVITLPVVTGTPTLGATLSVDNGTWTGSPTSYAYAWQRCDVNAANCTPISGATTANYMVVAGDSGYRLRAQVTATNAAGSTPTWSKTTALAGVPAVVSLPVVTGPATIGETLSVDNGTWTGSPTSYAFAWQRCDVNATNCTPISGATTASHVIVAGDSGYRLRAQVTATNAAGSTPTWSKVTALIGGPTVITLPVLTGSTVVGGTLSVDNGTWTGNPTSFSFVWQRCDANATNCTPISGATTASHVIVAGDSGYRLRAQVTATNAAGSTPTWSSVTAMIGALSAVSLPVVTGSATIGETLSVSDGTWTATPTAYSYEWQRCDVDAANCTSIAGEVTASHLVVTGDAGYRLRVRVIATNAAGSTSAWSKVTALIGAPAATSLPVLTGSATLGATLSISDGTWTGSPTAYNYEWQRCDADAANCNPIAGAATTSHVVVAGDIGFRLRVRVTATNAAGSTSTWTKVTALIGAPAVVTLPAVTGAVNQGVTVGVSDGTWTGSPTAYSYEWQRCDSDAANCNPIGGATTASHLVVPADTGYRLRVRVTATNAAGATAAFTKTTALVGSAA